MRSVYEDKRIPLQIRRLIIFINICKKAKNSPDKLVYLADDSKLAFCVQYLKDRRRYIAYGGIFKYAHTRAEVVAQGVDKLPHDEWVMCAITVKSQAFTRATRTPLGLLIDWNKHVNNRSYRCIEGNVKDFFKVNDELEIDYPAHEFHERLVASAQLPLWNNEKIHLKEPILSFDNAHAPKI